jgi:hypothetical protein
MFGEKMHLLTHVLSICYYLDSERLDGLIQPFLLHEVLWVRNLGKALLASFHLALHGAMSLERTFPRWHLSSHV